MGVPEPVHRLTEAEYLERERLAEYKSEYFDGEVFAMSGGTPPHSQIAANAIRVIGNQLSGRCVVYTSDLRLKIEATGLLTYPDFSVVCGPLQFAEGTEDTVVNPTLVGEVLSDSTEAYDRGKKFENYRQMPSLLEYLLVSQKEARIEQFSRGKEGSWVLRDAAGLEASLFLPSLEVTLALSDIFAGVKFAPTPIRPPTPARI
ncbi:MAG: Uma2 family endonuclease [Verrucomicrobia bacterium]|nr:Uma2 family endonuclease [Verrucomicrobiota bacterium]